MKVILQRSENAPWQRLQHEWFGESVTPPFEFRFRLTPDALVFSARRPAPALLHPLAREGQFQEHLWKYDTAEFFIATADAERYLEFNLAPNGAWWAAAFTAPRLQETALPTVPQGVRAHGHAGASGWECEAQLPLAPLRLMGISPGESPFRLAAAAILGSPEQRFLTTATEADGRPDFHRPWSWELAELAPPA